MIIWIQYETSHQCVIGGVEFAHECADRLVFINGEGSGGVKVGRSGIGNGKIPVCIVRIQSESSRVFKSGGIWIGCGIEVVPGIQTKSS